MVTQFKFDEQRTVYTRITPSFNVFLAQFGGMLAFVYAIGTALVAGIPEYLFKVNVIQSLYRFRSEYDIQKFLNKEGQNENEEEEEK